MTFKRGDFVTHRDVHHLRLEVIDVGQRKGRCHVGMLLRDPWGFSTWVEDLTEYLVVRPAPSLNSIRPGDILGHRVNKGMRWEVVALGQNNDDDDPESSPGLMLRTLDGNYCWSSELDQFEVIGRVARTARSNR